jgi:hypothetical protein
MRQQSQINISACLRILQAVSCQLQSFMGTCRLAGASKHQQGYHDKHAAALQVTVIDEDAKQGLYEQAATQAGIPVICRKEPLKSIGRMMPQTADAVVMLSRLQEVDDLSAFLKSVHRILRTGGRCDMFFLLCAESCPASYFLMCQNDTTVEACRVPETEFLFQKVQIECCLRMKD